MDTQIPLFDGTEAIGTVAAEPLHSSIIQAAKLWFNESVVIFTDHNSIHCILLRKLQHY